nr:ATPase, T2SS/T4P/T4SS family [Angustibacter aerolatus]
MVATRGDLLAAIDRYYRADADLDDLTTALGGDAAEEEELSKVKEIVDDAPIVKYVNLLIMQAIQDRASDIHLEPSEHDLRVRYRIDGVLHEVMRSPRAIQSGVISRLKIMADIDIAERRVPQDGRLSVNANGRKIDLRVATLPTVWGEKVVMRILDNSTASLDLADLGFSAANYERFSKSLGEALRHDPGDRAHRVGQVDDALRHAEHRQQARGQRHHRRGPGRVPVAGHQPGAGEREGGPDLRGRAALDPALRPRHRAARRDPRPRDRADRRRGVADRSPGAVDAAHERRAVRDHPADRDGHRALPGRLGAGLRAGAAAHPQAVLAVQGGLRAGRAGPAARGVPVRPARLAAAACTGRSAARRARAPATRAGSRCTR